MSDTFDVADERWNALTVERPELAPAIALQRTLLTEVLRTEARLESGRLPRLSLPPKYVVAKLARGVPILKGEPIPLPVALLAPLVPRLCAALAEGGAGDAATHIREAVESARLDAGALLAGLLARDQQGVRLTSAQMGLASDLVWLVGELAVAPFVHVLQQRLTHGHDLVERQLAEWSRGFCPICGSWPALAELCYGGRALRCSFCAFAWTPPEYQCTYCAEQENFGPAAPDPERADRLIELCAACAGYLKALVVDSPLRYPLIAIEDLATIDLDQAAMERGFVRPPLPTI
jgi:FdhE protein